MKNVPTASLALLAASILAGPLTAQEKQPLVPSLTVVGSGKVSASPDMAQVQVGVVTQAPSAGQALEDNNKAMTRLLATLDGKGIPRKDVQTSSFHVSPRHQRAPSGEAPPEIIGYQVSNMVRVKVRKIALLGEILDEVVQQGASQIQGIRFSVVEPGPLLDQARRQAVADAHRKAALYARAAGVGVGKVLLIQEETPHAPIPFLAGAGGADAVGVPIAEGELDFHASITITYALKDGAASIPKTADPE